MTLEETEILLIHNKKDAFERIRKLQITQRKKTHLRSVWKQKHSDPQQQHIDLLNEQIIQVKEEIERLQTKLQDLMKKVSRIDEENDENMLSEAMCCVCKNDAEGYDLPCKHDICYSCYENLLNDSQIICPVCQQEFKFEPYYDTSSSETEEEMETET